MDWDPYMPEPDSPHGRSTAVWAGVIILVIIGAVALLARGVWAPSAVKPAQLEPRLVNRTEYVDMGDAKLMTGTDSGFLCVWQNGAAYTIASVSNTGEKQWQNTISIWGEARLAAQGEMLALADTEAQQAYIFAASSGEPQTVDLPAAPAKMVISAQGYLAISYADESGRPMGQTIEVLNLEGETVAKIPGGGRELLSFYLSYDSPKLVCLWAGSKDESINLFLDGYDLLTSQSLFSLDLGQDVITGFLVKPGTDRIAVASGRQINVYDGLANQIYRYTAPGEVQQMCFLGNTDTLAFVVERTSPLRLRKEAFVGVLENGRVTRNVTLPLPIGKLITPLRGGQVMVTGADEVHMLNPDLRPRWTLKSDWNGATTALSPDGALILVYTDTGDLRVYSER